MNLTQLTEEISTVGVNRLLIDIIRDNLVKQSHRDYKTIRNAIKVLTGIDDAPSEGLRRFDELFRGRQVLTINMHKGDSVDDLRMVQRRKYERAFWDFIRDHVTFQKDGSDFTEKPIRTTYFYKNGQVCATKVYKRANRGPRGKYMTWEEGR